MADKRFCGAVELLFFVACYLVVALQTSSAARGKRILIEIDSGKVRGQVKSFPSLGRRSVAQFLGIPYAEPPMGKLRFSAPQPVQRWSGKRDAKEFRSRCPQNPWPFPFNVTVGPTSENCLFVNVFAPAPLQENKTRPVMVWIHGGAFYLGSGNEYDASVLAALQDVIVVTFNYRLGLLGFLNIPQTDIKGNYGMLDQVEALKWVQRNIRFFGGDPDQVTLFGVDSGAISVTLHMLSPLSQGLFHRAVSQSGTAIAPFATFNTTNPKYGKTFLERLKCDGQSGAELLTCMRNKPYTDFMAASQDLAALALGPLWPVVTVDGDFLPDDPLKLLREKRFHKVSLMIGVNKDESVNVLPLETIARFLSENISRDLLERLVRRSIFTKNGEPEVVKKAILYEYTNHANPEARESIINSWRALVTESWFVAPAVQMAKAVDNAGGSAYMYFFDHRSTFSVFPEAYGVPHADELMYVFGSPYRRLHTFPFASGFTDVEKGFSSFVMKLWTNFAKNGDPNLGKGSLQIPASWPQFTAKDPRYLRLDLDPKVEGPFSPKRMAFWNEFVPSLKNPQ